MYLTSNQCSVLGQFMVLQASADDSNLMRQKMGLLMLRYLNADTYSSLVWNPDSDAFEDAIGVNETPGRLKAWDDYFRFIDPVTQPMFDRRTATTASQVIAPSDMIKTEFFNDFLRPHNQYWGINIYFYAGDNCLGDFRIWRKRSRGDFDKNDAERLNMLAPSMVATLQRLKKTPREQSSKALSAEASSQTGLIFDLTRRENEVASMIAFGFSDKRIAAELQISSSTVRFHLNNIFLKSATSNRTGLASRIRSLT
ncbi:helix-turn-helix transcriptional regulator [Pectobacterium versatile]|uniref:HTH-type transcriptional regulator MalT n=1 Tax=Pectobacterium versatile TaxID=2488639 RepID=A0A855M9V3_9GAMM|nr:LuxR C-terminal-related transcriptional regulator [Pectobacterium versatile]POY48812.1 HTH-type transcriptional regulator MalT [Pectobacterium versatile]QPK17095.1 response regulator transcription factor [Pectobacterium versatile]